MKRLDYLQQKLPLSLHRTEILEGLEILVCLILHTCCEPARFSQLLTASRLRGPTVPLLQLPNDAAGPEIICSEWDPGY
jgi:hypothetical protein